MQYPAIPYPATQPSQPPQLQPVSQGFYNMAIIPVAIFGLFQHFFRERVTEILPKHYGAMWKVSFNQNI